MDHSIDFFLPRNGTVDLPFTRGYIVGSSRHNLIILRCLPAEILDLPARRHIVQPEGFTMAWWIGDSPRIEGLPLSETAHLWLLMACPQGLGALPGSFRLVCGEEVLAPFSRKLTQIQGTHCH